MSRRKEEGRKREKKSFSMIFTSCQWHGKKAQDPFQRKEKDGKLWLNIIQHDSSSLTFFLLLLLQVKNLDSSEPEFASNVSFLCNQIKSNQLEWNEWLPSEKNISRFFRGYVFGREEGIEGNKCWRRTPFTVVGVTLSRTRSPGFKVHKMLSA